MIEVTGQPRRMSKASKGIRDASQVGLHSRKSLLGWGDRGDPGNSQIPVDRLEPSFDKLHQGITSSLGDTPAMFRAPNDEHTFEKIHLFRAFLQWRRYHLQS